jgi:hypothetical protein
VEALNKFASYPCADLAAPELMPVGIAVRETGKAGCGVISVSWFTAVEGELIDRAWEMATRVDLAERISAGRLLLA